GGYARASRRFFRLLAYRHSGLALSPLRTDRYPHGSTVVFRPVADPAFLGSRRFRSGNEPAVAEGCFTARAPLRRLRLAEVRSRIDEVVTPVSGWRLPGTVRHRKGRGRTRGASGTEYG